MIALTSPYLLSMLMLLLSFISMLVYRPISSVGNGTAIGAGGLGFVVGAGQSGHMVATASNFEAVLPSHKTARMGPATRYTPRRISLNRVIIM